MKKILKTWLYLFTFLICTYMSVTDTFAAAKKTVKVSLEQEYESCTFTVSMDKKSNYKGKIYAPDGTAYSCDKIDNQTLRCVIPDVTVGEWKVKVSSSKLEKIGKVSVSVTASRIYDRDIASEISVGKDIAGKKIYFKNDSICAEWTDDTCGNVTVKVIDLDNNRTLANENISGKSFELELSPNVKKISLSLVPTTSANIKGAEKIYTLDVNNHPDASVQFPDNYYINTSDVTVSVDSNGNYGFLVMDNGKKVVENDIENPGQYEVSVPLGEDGEHEIEFFVVDENGNMRSTSKTFMKDMIPPNLALDKEYDGAVVKGTSITISGTVKEAESLMINEADVSPASDGHFDYECVLHTGENQITISATDIAGNSVDYNILITAVEESTSNSISPFFIIACGVIIIIILFKKRRNSRYQRKNVLSGRPQKSIEPVASEDEDNEEADESDTLFSEYASMNNGSTNHTAHKARKQESFANTSKNQRKSSIKRSVVAEIISYAVATAILFITLVYLLQVTRIPSESMMPTLKVNDYIVSNRLAYKKRSPQRGDIIVFQSDEFGQLLCKRVIGTPGDEISFANGFVYINNEIYDESAYIPEDIESNCADSFTVPEGCYFVMGDNREISDDSRFWEDPYVPLDKIESKMIFVIPLHNFLK